MTRFAKILAVLAIGVSCSPTAAHAERVEDSNFKASAHAVRVEDPNLKFSLTIPVGFVRDRQIEAVRPDFVYGFRKSEANGGSVVIIIERLHGTIGRERLNASNMPAGFAGKLLTLRWRDFDVEAFEVPEEANGIKVINYNVQVPLKPEAIQIRVAGRRDQKEQLLQLTNELLGSLRGESNWLESVAPPALAQSPHYGSMILAACGVAVIAGLIVLWLVRRVSPRGTVLGLAIVIYAVSWLIGPGESREMRATVGAVRLLGFLGLFFGVFDLLRHPARKRPGGEPPPFVDQAGA